MTSPRYEPRRVEHGAVRRWTLAAVRLAVHRPLAHAALFLGLLVLTSVLDTYLSAASDITAWPAFLGATLLVYPVLCYSMLFVIAMSRTDSASISHWRRIPDAGRGSGVAGAMWLLLLIGAAAHLVITLLSVPAGLASGSLSPALIGDTPLFATAQSRLAMALAVSIAAFGPLGLPLIIVSGLRDLSLLASLNRRAARVNGRDPWIVRLAPIYLLLTLTAIALSIENRYNVPGLVNGVTIFALSYQYVAFRDVFEHQAPPRSRHRHIPKTRLKRLLH